MTNAELINELRYCFVTHITVIPWYVWCDLAADALEAADKLNTELIKNIERWKKDVVKLRAQMPKEGEWIRKEVKVYCPRDCWNQSARAIDGTWNEAEGWNLEMQDGFCSVCGEQDEKYHKHHYCPNCGMKMRGEEQC